MSKRSAAKEKRLRMVERQIAERGILDTHVLAAMRRVPRETFVPVDKRNLAYEDRPVSIGAGQTISQPYIVAAMIEALHLAPGDKMLEIGGGSGYASAVAAQIAGRVFTIERIPELAQAAKENLLAAGIGNVTVQCGDGTEGWPEEAPFDAILVSAGAPEAPQTLLHQLTIGGRMVIPVGSDPTAQDLVRITRTGAEAFQRVYLTSVRFVPLIGREGWQPDVS